MTAIKPKAEVSPTFKVAVDKDILCCKYTPNSRNILAGHIDGALKLYESRTGELVKTLERENLHEEVPVTSVQFKNRAQDPHNALTTYTDGRVVVWNYKTGSMVSQANEERQTLGCVYHPKLAKFLTTGDDAIIHLYDEETMQVIQTFEKGEQASVCDGHVSRVFAAQFHPVQPTEFVSGGWDSVMHFWDTRQRNSTRYVKGVHMCGEGLDFNKSGRELLTCSYSRETPLQMWHYQSGRLLANIEPDQYKSMLYCGQWVTPDVILLGGTDPNLLRVVSLKTLSTVLYYKGNTSGVYSLDHALKPPPARISAAKKDLGVDMKVAFSIDKSLVEIDASF